METVMEVDSDSEARSDGGAGLKFDVGDAEQEEERLTVVESSSSDEEEEQQLSADGEYDASYENASVGSAPKPRKRKKSALEKILEERANFATSSSRKRKKVELFKAEPASQKRSKTSDSPQTSPAQATAVWDQESKDVVLKGLSKYGRNWRAIAELVPNKTWEQVRNWYQNNKKKLQLQKYVSSSAATDEDIVKNEVEEQSPIENIGRNADNATWQHDEESALVKYYLRYGPDWESIAAKIPHKSSMEAKSFFQLRQNSSNWQPSEELRIITAIRRLGMENWDSIAAAVLTKNEARCRSWYDSNGEKFGLADPPSEEQDGKITPSWSESEKAIFDLCYRKYSIFSKQRFLQVIRKITTLIPKKDVETCEAFYLENYGKLEEHVEKQWTEEEKSKFIDAFLTYGKNWVRVASEFQDKNSEDCHFYYINHRKEIKQAARSSPQSVEMHIPRSAAFNPYHNPWTEIEIAEFREYLEEFGKDFERIASMFAGRTKKHCKDFYDQNADRLGFKEALRKGGRPVSETLHHTQLLWPPEAKEKFVALVGVYGKDFNKIASALPGKSWVQCRNFYSNNRVKLNLEAHLPPNYQEPEQSPAKKASTTLWSSEDKDQFIDLLKIHGKDWDAIASNFPGRTPGQAKNWFANNKDKLRLHSYLPVGYKAPSPSPAPIRGKGKNAPLWPAEYREKFKEYLREYGKDFEAIASHFPDRTANQARNFYTNHKDKLKLDKYARGEKIEEAPKRDKKPLWPDHDRVKFKDLLREHGKDWDAIASYFPEKTADQARNFFTNHRVKLRLDQFLDSPGREGEEEEEEAISSSVSPAPWGKKSQLWSAEDKEKFKQLLRKHGKDFEAFLPHFPGKMLSQIKNFYSNERRRDSSIDAIINKLSPRLSGASIWGHDEVRKLKDLLGEYGKNFTTIASRLESKSLSQIRNFYTNHRVNLKLDSYIMQKPVTPPGRLLWSEAEKEKYKKLLKKHGKSWEEIADAFPNKSAAQCKNFYANHKDKLGLEDILKGEPEETAVWTNEEKEKLYEIVAKYGRNTLMLSETLGTKSRLQCRNFLGNNRTRPKLKAAIAKFERSGEKGGVSTAPQPPRKGQIWSDTDKTLWPKYLEKYGRNWDAIAQEFGDKTPLQCKSWFSNNRYNLNLDQYLSSSSSDHRPKGMQRRESSSANSRRSRESSKHWSENEKSEFLLLLMKHGKKFDMIADEFRTRTTEQCREFFDKNRKELDMDAMLGKPRSAANTPSPSHRNRKQTETSSVGSSTTSKHQRSSWDEDEKDLFPELLTRYGKDWTAIAKHFDHKSAVQCKYYFHNNKKARNFESYLPPESPNLTPAEADSDYGEVNEKDALETGSDRGEEEDSNDEEEDSNDDDDDVVFLPRNDSSLQGQMEKIQGGMSALEQCLTINRIKHENSKDRGSINRWTLEEREILINLLHDHGRDWNLIAKKIQSKTAQQARQFYRNHKRALHLHLVVPPGAMSKPPPALSPELAEKLNLPAFSVAGGPFTYQTLKQPEIDLSQASLQDWLKHVGFEAFFQPLKDLGVNNVADLEYLAAHDLTAMGMKIIQMRKFASMVTKAGIKNISLDSVTEIGSSTTPSSLPPKAQEETQSKLGHFSQNL